MNNISKGYKQTEVGVIPEGWEVKRLGEITKTVASGKSKFKAVSGLYIVYGSTGAIGFNDDFDYEGEKILVARVGANAGTVNCVEGKYCVSDNTLIVDLKGDFDFSYAFHFLKHYNLNKLIFGSGQPLITGSQLKNLEIPLPPTKAEQTAIATVLSDTDALISSLEKLIAKKRNIKQGAMQELLTGKKRLPGFNEEWKVKSFGSILLRLDSRDHQIQTSDYQTTGIYPVVDQGKELVIGYSDRDDKVFRCPEGGVIIFGDHTCIVKFVDFDFVVGADGTQVLATRVGQCVRFHAFQLEHSGISPTGYNRHFKFLKEREFAVPSLPEQTAIAQILTDMDAEIGALEQKLDKYRQIKQGMMQELLTGKTRLI